MDQEKEVHVIILKGPGRAFCAGIDVSEMSGKTTLEYQKSFAYMNEAFARLCSTDDAKEGVSAFFEKRVFRNRKIIAEIPDAKITKTEIPVPNTGRPMMKASRTNKLKAMIAILLNRNDFSLGSRIAIRIWKLY
jgi:enoyl-CoA hydratase/carnithine racemase